MSQGNYGRYLEAIWANDIIQYEHIRNEPFPTYPSLFSNANGYRFNLLPAITLSTASLITDAAITSLQIMPLYGFAFFFSVVLVAHAIYRSRQQEILMAVVLSFFFLYPNNGIASEVNRIVLSYSIFFLFIYCLVRNNKGGDLRFDALGMMFLLFFIMCYSSNAISAVPFVLAFFLLRYSRTGEKTGLLLLVLYMIITTFYYLVITDFLAGTLLGFSDTLRDEGLQFHFLFTRPGIWPIESAYTPDYSLMDWFLLALPFAIIAILALLSFSVVKRGQYATRVTDDYLTLVYSFAVFIIFSIVFNGFMAFPTAGLDYIVLFSWAAPVLSAPGLTVLLSSHKKERTPSSRPRYLIRVRTDRSHFRARNGIAGHYRRLVPLLRPMILVVIVGFGIMAIVSNEYLPQRAGERVTTSETVSSYWFGEMNLNITSDLHYTSVYVTLMGESGSHVLPMDEESIESYYYKIDLTLLKSSGVEAYILTRTMETQYISHFVGGRTIPNPELALALSGQCIGVYDNGDVRAYLL